ncbi:MAG: hypothetical protein ACREBB_02460 [Nitrosotalea sp.]
MERFAVISLITVGAMFLGVFGTAYASPQISIVTSKPTYEYGESLAFSITVSNVTGDTAVLEIIDQSNQSSSPIDMTITKPVSNITAPVPFYRTTFLPGMYFIKVQYSGANATASFQIIDTENIVIPPQFKEVADSWAQNQTSNKLFGENISYLVNSSVIKINGYQEQNTTIIPVWLKNDALWWSNGSISDNDFGHVIEYLLESGIMKV